MYSCGPLHMAEERQDDQLEHTCSNSVPIWDVALKTCQKQWTVERNGEESSEISVLIAWQDEDGETVTINNTNIGLGVDDRHPNRFECNSRSDYWNSMWKAILSQGGCKNFFLFPLVFNYRHQVINLARTSLRWGGKCCLGRRLLETYLYVFTQFECQVSR